MTPTGNVYVGVDFAKKLCGVSVIRSGESMETALRECCQGIKIGKILVHRCGGCAYDIMADGMSKNYEWSLMHRCAAEGDRQ